MNKEIHIWMNDVHAHLNDANIDNAKSLVFSRFQTMVAFKNLDLDWCDRIDTVQTFVCSIDNLKKGYRIFVHMIDFEEVEIKLGTNNKHTKRNIRVENNLENLLLNNEFGLAVE